MFANTCVHAEYNLLDTSFHLTNKEGIVAAKMKIVLSLIPGSGDNIKDVMKRIDHDISYMSSLPCSSSTLWQILKSTKAVMDGLLQLVFQV